MRILIVEDDQDGREMYATFLEGDGFRVTKAATGSQAQEACAARRPDVVVLDLVLPDVDGFELADRIIKSEPSLPIPIVAVTALRLKPGEVARLHAGGARTVLYKPCEPDVLLAAILRIVNTDSGLLHAPAPSLRRPLVASLPPDRQRVFSAYQAICADDQVIYRTRVDAAGRSRCRASGRPVMPRDRRH